MDLYERDVDKETMFLIFIITLPQTFLQQSARTSQIHHISWVGAGAKKFFLAHLAPHRVKIWVPMCQFFFLIFFDFFNYAEEFDHPRT